MDNNGNQEKPFKYECIKCNFVTCNKKDFNRHNNTIKHIMITNDNEKPQKTPKNPLPYKCNCGKEYIYKSGLSRHKKTCNFEESSNIIKNENKDEMKELVFKLIHENNEIKNTLLKENQELRAQVSELIPKIGNNNTNIHNNQKFNIQIFLNEHCKHAINMKDFIESIKISLNQLDLIKNKGLAEGLTNAILENISKLSLYERPIHCTDIKRETLYIKDNDIWEKDNSKENIKKAIKEISHKPYYTLKEWLSSNPNYMEDENKQNYFIQTTRTLGKNSDTIDEKVIKKICLNI